MKDYMCMFKLIYKSSYIQNENKLKEDGYDKTPDVLLEIPMLIDGNIVNWIESKALFGSIESHQTYRKHQYKCYVNR